MWRTAWLWCLLATIETACLGSEKPANGDPCSATEATDDANAVWAGDLSARMLDGAHRYIDRKIAASVRQRARHWHRDLSSPKAYAPSVEPNRQRFAKRIGVVGDRLPVTLERFGDDDNPALVCEMPTFRVYQVRWPVLAGVCGEGLLLEPTRAPSACVVVLPDADQTPEQFVGLAPGVDDDLQWPRRLAESGCAVIVPALIDRDDRFTGNAVSGRPNPGYSHREWIYRQAYHLGRHVIGYEVQKTLAAIDWFQSRYPGTAVGAAGYGEGALIAFYAAAIDPRIQATMVSGYFRSRQRVAEEPLYRNVWALLDEFGDAEIASLIAPRALTVEHRRGPELIDRQTTTPERSNDIPLDGIHGRLDTPDWHEVADEFARLGELVPDELQARRLINAESAAEGQKSAAALDAFCQDLGVKLAAADGRAPLVDSRRTYDPQERQRRQLKQLEDSVQGLVNDSHLDRERFCRVDRSSLDAFVASTRRLRDYAWRELFGKFEEPLLPANARLRKAYERPKWTGYEVLLDVFPDVFAWGVLLVPEGLQPGEKRPVVVCQHGRNGLPKDVIEGDQRAYHDFAARLADEGFVVFAPHNPYRGEDRYRWLSRKANGVKASLFSFILAQHEQILNWLASLDYVDDRRIAFYGLSYGGETAVRVPPLLERYCLSICSADFNDWTRKVASTHSPYSFMFTIEWEMPYFDMGRTFGYAELVNLMVPRPFMVERGHDDGVAPDEWVAHEYAKVRRTYDQLGIGDRTAIEFFNGGHTIHATGTFAFLRKHLNWPEAAEQAKQVFKPDLFETLVNPNCSHCVDEAQRRASELRDNDRVLAWTRGKYEGGAIPWRFFLVPYRVISDTYGVFVYDADAGFVRGYEPSLDFRFHGWRNGILVIRHKDGTLYSALSGRAFDGPRKGDQLKPIATLETDWGHWINAYPGSVAYHMFDKYQPQEVPQSESADSVSTRLEANPHGIDGRTRVIGLALGDRAKSWPLAALEAAGGIVADELAGEKLVVLWYPATQTAAIYSPEVEQTDARSAKQTLTFVRDETNERAPFRDRETGSQWGIEGRAVDGPLKGKTLRWLPGVQCRWFAWAAEYPESELSPGPRDVAPPGGKDIPNRQRAPTGAATENVPATGMFHFLVRAR